MKKYALNGIYLFVIFLPLIFIASLPTWLLNTGQGGELLSSIWQDRPMALTALIAFPYLFSMYTASASLLLKAVDTLPVTSDGEKSLPTVSRKQVVFASLIGAFGTLFSFMPMYSFQRIDAISSSMNEGFVSRWYYVCGAILLGLIGMGLCASYRLLHASGRKWLKFIFNPGTVYFSICSFIYINQVYFKALSKASGYGDANREALVFFFFLVVVTCVIPGPRSLRDSTLTAEQGSRSLIKRIKFVRYEQRAMVLGILTLLLFAMFPAKVGLLLGSLLVLVAGLGAWSVLCGLVWPLLLRGKFRLPRLVTLTAIAVWLAMCSSHTLVADRVNTKFSNNGSSATSSAGEVITISEDYVAWNKQSDAPTIIILAEGGGIRASYWTGLCLGMLSLPTVDLMSRTYAIIGVSGGSLGVASFMANYVAAEQVMQAKPYDFSKYSNPSGIAEGTTRNALNSDFLGPWMARVISTENIQKLIPFRLAPSKGETLQDAWRTALTCGADTNPNFPSSLEICALVEPILNAPMASFPRKLGDRELPRMVFVSTHVETGERILFSSINYGHEKIYGAKFMEALAPGQVGLLSAAHSSARFPLVSPPARFFTRMDARRVTLSTAGMTTTRGLRLRWIFLRPFPVRRVRISIQSSSTSIMTPTKHLPRQRSHCRTEMVESCWQSLPRSRIPEEFKAIWPSDNC